MYSSSNGGNRGFLGEKSADNILDIAFNHPIKIIVNALGVPPLRMLELAKANNVACGALVGNRQQAIKQAESGVDIIISSGTEAGGHCGEISTWSWCLKVVQALQGFEDVSILAAGVSLRVAKWPLLWPWGQMVYGPARFG